MTRISKILDALDANAAELQCEALLDYLSKFEKHEMVAKAKEWLHSKHFAPVDIAAIKKAYAAQELPDHPSADEIFGASEAAGDMEPHLKAAIQHLGAAHQEIEASLGKGSDATGEELKLINHVKDMIKKIGELVHQ